MAPCHADVRCHNSTKNLKTVHKAQGFEVFNGMPDVHNDNIKT